MPYQHPAAEHQALRQPDHRSGPLLAVLIDADNAQPSLLGLVLAEAAKHGTVTVRRIYADWTSTRMTQWKEQVQSHALHAVQQFQHTSGKNSTDMALAIDAMDLLHAGRLDGFCIVSSDSDFTRLATRIREQGLLAMGIGRRCTPKAFVTACEMFVYTENLHAPAVGAEPAAVADDWTGMLSEAVEHAQQEDGWASLSQVGNLLQQMDPAFDPRSYGMPGGRLSLLVKSRPDLFEIDARAQSGGRLMVRARDAD